MRNSTSGSWQSRSSTSVATASDGTLPSLPEPLDANSLCKPSRDNVESMPGSVYTLNNNAFPFYNVYKDNVTSMSEASPIHQAVPLESNSVGAMGVRVGTRAPQAKSINKVEKTLEKTGEPKPSSGTSRSRKRKICSYSLKPCSHNSNRCMLRRSVCGTKMRCVTHFIELCRRHGFEKCPACTLLTLSCTEIIADIGHLHAHAGRLQHMLTGRSPRYIFRKYFL